MESTADLVIAGHPLIPIGMGEHARMVFKSLKKPFLNVFDVRLRDIYGRGDHADGSLAQHFGKHATSTLSSRVNIFTINGDEVQPVMAHLGKQWPKNAYNIVYPAWELSNYPKAWATELERFDEVWAISKFTRDSIAKSVSKPVRHMPLACEPVMDAFLDRRYFGIPEASYVFLFSFDFLSWLERKNPMGAIKAFEMLCDKYPRKDVRLVIKVSNGDQRPKDYARFLKSLEGRPVIKDKVIIINKMLQTREIKNLVASCDCFISLHRSEGFGLGLTEAMFLGKPVIATGYSGNMDYMTKDNSCLVKYKLIPVGKDQYPHAKGQVWADPDVTQAAKYMEKLVIDRDHGLRLGEKASRTIRQHFSCRAAGLRYATRLKELKLL